MEGRNGRINWLFFSVGYVEERLWWPIQILNIGRKKKANKRRERDKIKFMVHIQQSKLAKISYCFAGPRKITWWCLVDGDNTLVEYFQVLGSVFCIPGQGDGNPY